MENYINWNNIVISGTSQKIRLTSKIPEMFFNKNIIKVSFLKARNEKTRKSKIKKSLHL